jgi:hypothetical protein
MLLVRTAHGPPTHRRSRDELFRFRRTVEDAAPRNTPERIEAAVEAVEIGEIVRYSYGTGNQE